MLHSDRQLDRHEAGMARRGGAATQSFLPVAAIIAVLLFLGVVLLVLRSSHHPSGPSLGITSPSPSTSAPSGASTSPSPAPTTPGPGAVAPSVTPSGAPTPGAVGPSAGAVSPSAAPTAPAGGVPPQAAGPGHMPNTGAPFPWWMGLLPVSLGIGLMRALRRRPEPLKVAAGASAGAGPALRDRRPASRPRGRPASGLGRKRP